MVVTHPPAGGITVEGVSAGKVAGGAGEDSGLEGEAGRKRWELDK